MAIFASKGARRSGRTAGVTNTRYTIGRLPDCDLVLPKSTVSRQHLVPGNVNACLVKLPTAKCS
ncbi:FHA domain-containing protein [Trichothermofontia sp.]